MKIAIVLSALALSASSAMACSLGKTDTQASLHSDRQQATAASQAEQVTVVAKNASGTNAAETAATATE
ncbi:hypothetical protein [Bosea vaviloviae]|uniref:Lipoprotein n=1 Tax=Bosea vaviloviae TaxID=1526658 RepID=A0A1D7U2I5_9HYPH|nr:hypothetical protein [Bosea vaviloviae]AOO81588.1 hypothetical protein BHK69_14990 [Bosea vaviloviae]